MSAAFLLAYESPELLKLRRGWQERLPAKIVNRQSFKAISAAHVLAVLVCRLLFVPLVFIHWMKEASVTPVWLHLPIAAGLLMAFLSALAFLAVNFLADTPVDYFLIPDERPDASLDILKEGLPEHLKEPMQELLAAERAARKGFRLKKSETEGTGGGLGEEKSPSALEAAKTPTLRGAVAVFSSFVLFFLS